MISLAAGGTPVSATTTNSCGASLTIAAIFRLRPSCAKTRESLAIRSSKERSCCWVLRVVAHRPMR
eukprot:5859902-Prymnesium_polylepis.1